MKTIDLSPDNEKLWRGRHPLSERLRTSADELSVILRSNLIMALESEPDPQSTYTIEGSAEPWAYMAVFEVLRNYGADVINYRDAGGNLLNIHL